MHKKKYIKKNTHKKYQAKSALTINKIKVFLNKNKFKFLFLLLELLFKVNIILKCYLYCIYGI